MKPFATSRRPPVTYILLLSHVQQDAGVIPHGKRAIGDSGYKGEPNKISVTRDTDDDELRRFKGRVKSRQENFDARLKNFRILSIPFRHGHANHQSAFVACCICMQYEIENGNGLFEV